MHEDEDTPSVVNFLPVLNRYKWHALFFGSALFLVVSAIILSLPPVYRSAGKVLVETQQIPTELVKSTITTLASERIDVIRQRVMTRGKLLEIIKRYSFFTLDDDTPLALSSQLEEVRNAISLSLITGGKQGRGAVNAIAFEVGFESTDPYVAQSVANELVTLFLSENLKIRTERASETTEFLKAQAEKVKGELEFTEAAVAKYKQEHKEALPEHLRIYTDIRESANLRLNELKRDIRSTQDKIEYNLSQVSPGETGSDLYDLRYRLAQARLKYTERHPDVMELERQLRQLEASGVNPSNDGVNPAILEKNKQLSKLRSYLRSLRRELKVSESKIVDMESRILKIPQVERELISLTRENGIKEEQYNMLVMKARTAEIAESLEAGRKSERFSIIEPPIRPAAPIRPNRQKLLLLGFAFSYGLPIGLVLLLGFLNKNVMGPKSLSIVTDIPIISIFPHVYSRAELRGKKMRFIGQIVTIGLLILIALFAVQFLYMPLDELLPKVLFRISA